MTDTCTCHWQPARIGQPMDADLDPACPIHGAADVSSGPDIPDAAVEAARATHGEHYPLTYNYPTTLCACGQEFPTEGEHKAHRWQVALAAAYPALTRQAVAADRVRWLNVTDAVAAERERIATAIEAAKTGHEYDDDIRDDDARIARAGGTP